MALLNLSQLNQGVAPSQPVAQPVAPTAKYANMTTQEALNSENSNESSSSSLNAGDVASNTLHGIGKYATDFYNNALGDVTNAQKGIASDFSQTESGKINPLVGALGTIANVVKGGLSPIESAFQTPVSEVNELGEQTVDNSKPVQNAATSKVGDLVTNLQNSIAKIAANHPQASSILDSISTIAGALVGGEEAPADLDATNSDVAGIKEGLTPDKPTPEDTQENEKKSDNENFNKNIQKAKNILNPSGKLSLSEKGSAMAGGNVETQGKGIFAREIVNPKTTSIHETLADMVNQGKISEDNWPHQNVQALNTEARVHEDNIKGILGDDKLNIPINKSETIDALENAKQSGIKSRQFVSQSTASKAYEDVFDIAKEEAQDEKGTVSGIRNATKSFNSKMEKLLGTDIYEGNDEGVGNARIQAAKEARQTFSKLISEKLDSVQTGDALKTIQPTDAKSWIEKASNFNHASDFIKNQRDSFREKILQEDSYRAQNRRIARSMSKGLTLEQAWSKEGLSADVDSDLKDIWNMAHTDVKSQGVGSLFKSELQKEAQILSARDQLVKNSRGDIGKSVAELYLNQHPGAKFSTRLGQRILWRTIAGTASRAITGAVKGIMK